MKSEQNPGNRGADLERRARLHAALGDPARLWVVDLLSVGDASPKELQEALGMPSNLLAHHLGVLAREGLVVRHRSEADRRRSYLRVVPDVLDGLLPQRVEPATRVVFVCTANTARSQLAAALWTRASGVPATSAGTHPADAVAPGAVAVASRRGLPLRQVQPRALAHVLRSEDFLVTVCDNAHEELDRQHPSPRVAHSLHWSVPDPVPAGTDRAFDAAYDDLATRVANLASRLTN